MNELEPMIFPEDTEIPDPIVCLDVIAHGNLKVFSMDIKGILAVASTLEVETQLIVKGPANIGGFFRGNNCIAKFNSSCKIGKNIEGGTIEINGVLAAENVYVTDLIVNGSADVKGDIIAANEIRFKIRHTPDLKIGGVIRAPIIRFTYSKEIKRAIQDKK